MSKYTGAKIKMMMLAISDGSDLGPHSILEKCEGFNGTNKEEYRSQDYYPRSSTTPVGAKFYDASINNRTATLTH